MDDDKSGAILDYLNGQPREVNLPHLATLFRMAQATMRRRLEALAAAGQIDKLDYGTRIFWRGKGNQHQIAQPRTHAFRPLNPDYLTSMARQYAIIAERKG